MDDLDLGATIRGFALGQKVFNRYTLKKILGRGGMGVVWLARDGELDQELALKFLPELVMNDKASLDDLRRETRRALELTHPHIVRIHGFLRDEMTAAISMEYVPGDTLSNLRTEQAAGIFNPAQLQPWVKQLCEALDYAHLKARIVHRDLKPANLMLDGQGDLKITDFGISRSITDSVSRVSAQMGTSGTPVYMSPQQMMGDKAAPTDDIYALGATLYELLTGKPPFYSGNVLMQVQNKVPPVITARREELEVTGEPIPPEWEALVAACLAKEAKDRPQSAGEVWERLKGNKPPAGISRAPKQEEPKAATVQAAAQASAQPKDQEPRAKAPLYLALAASALVLAGLGYYFGSYVPEQGRLKAAAEQARLLEQNRLVEDRLREERKRVAEEQRLATEKQSALTQAQRDKEAREQQAQDEILALIKDLPVGAAEAQKADAKRLVESYERMAPPRFKGVAQSRWDAWLQGENKRLAEAASATAVPPVTVAPTSASTVGVDAVKREAEQKRAAAKLAAVRSGKSPLLLDGTIHTLFGTPLVLYAADSLKINRDYIGLEPANIRLGTVDLAKIYDSDPETERANEGFRAAEAAAQARLTDLNAEGQKMVDDYKELSAQSTNSALSSAARNRATTEAERKLKQIQDKQAEVKKFASDSQADLQAQIKTTRNRVLARIVTEQVKRLVGQGATLVLDVAGPSLFGISPVIYLDPSYVGSGVGGGSVKILTLDISQVYDGHYKTQEANAKLRLAEQQAQEQIDELNKQGQGLVDEYKALMEKSKNPALTAAVRGAAETEAQRKLEEIQSKQKEVEAFRTNSKNSLEQRTRTSRELLLEEIAKVATDLAVRKGCTLLIDTSGPGANVSLPFVVSADPAADVTQEVLAKINQDRPVR